MRHLLGQREASYGQRISGSGRRIIDPESGYLKMWDVGCMIRRMFIFSSRYSPVPPFTWFSLVWRGGWTGGPSSPLSDACFSSLVLPTRCRKLNFHRWFSRPGAGISIFVDGSPDPLPKTQCSSMVFPTRCRKLNFHRWLS